MTAGRLHPSARRKGAALQPAVKAARRTRLTSAPPRAPAIRLPFRMRRPLAQPDTRTQVSVTAEDVWRIVDSCRNRRGLRYEALIQALMIHTGAPPQFRASIVRQARLRLAELCAAGQIKLNPEAGTIYPAYKRKADKK